MKDTGHGVLSNDICRSTAPRRTNENSKAKSRTQQQLMVNGEQFLQIASRSFAQCPRSSAVEFSSLRTVASTATLNT